MARIVFVVNDALREKVRHLAGLGVPQDDIAKIVGCAPKTLRKRFRDELDRGVAEANAGPMVRIRFPPAESPCLAGFRYPTSRSPFGASAGCARR